MSIKKLIKEIEGYEYMNGENVVKFIGFERKEEEVYIVLDKIKYWKIKSPKYKSEKENTRIYLDSFSDVNSVLVEGNQTETLLKYFSLFPPKPVPDRPIEE